MKPQLLRCLIILTLFNLAGLVSAETVYINDQLRVGIRPEPNNESTPLAVVNSGDKLELLDKASGYMRVRTKGGVEGWIKDIYTTSQIPAIVQLQELTKSSGGTNQKVSELKEQVGIMQNANHALSSELEQIKSEREQLKIQLIGLKSSRPDSGYLFWIYSFAAVVVFAALSFLGGIFWFRRQAMKRLGGLRIYF